jgi:outer membrane receptor protein involved in Fe transport
MLELPVPPGGSVSFGDESVARRLLSYEAGYRVDLFDRALLDASFFYDDYHDANDAALASRIANNWVWGLEVSGRFWVMRGVRVEASYTYRDGEQVRREGPPLAPILVTRDLTGMARNMARLGVNWDVTAELGLDVDVFFTDETESLDTGIRVPAYARVDVGVRWRPMPGLELALTGTNLQDDAHPEDTTRERINTGVTRGALFSLTYEFN